MPRHAEPILTLSYDSVSFNGMGDRTEDSWTLEELATAAARVLSASGVEQASGRVGDLPRARDIRYYATLGVVDRPSSFRGRTALYGRRHLLQLVALKRLQAQGLTLAEIQARLVGLPASRLEALAQVPARALPAPSGPATRPPPAHGDSRTAFWSVPPALPTGPRTLQELHLAPGVRLVLESSPPLSSTDVAALKTAAAPLIVLLQRLTTQESP